MDASHIEMCAWTGYAEGLSNGGSRITYLTDDENIKKQHNNPKEYFNLLLLLL